VNHSETKKLIVTTGVPSPNVFAERVSLVNETGQQISAKTDAELTAGLVVRPITDGTTNQVLAIESLNPLVTKWQNGGEGGSSLWFDSAFYGGVQQAIDACRTTGNGKGTVWVPAGSWISNNQIRMYSGIMLLGAGPNASFIIQTNPNQHGIYGEDWRWVTIEGISLLGTGTTSGTSCGIKAIVTNTTARNALDYVTLKNVFVDQFPVDGISLDTPIVSHLDSVTVQHVGRHGFNIYCDQEDINGTSTTLTNCYAAGCRSAGFRMHRMSYCNVIGPASDANGISYWTYGCKSITYTSAGSETPYWQDSTYNGRTAYVYGSWGIVFIAPWFINNIGVCIDIQGESHVTLVNPFEGSPGNSDSTNNNPTHWLRVGIDCEVSIIDEQVVTTAEDIDSGAIIRRSSAWALKDRPNAWTANNEFQGTLYVPVGGTLLVEGTANVSALTVTEGSLTMGAGGIAAKAAEFDGNVALTAGKTLYVPGTATFEGTVTVPTPNTDTQAANKGYVDQMPINARTGADYTLALTDAGRVVEMDTNHKVRIPTNASVAFPIHTTIQVRQTGTSNVIVDAVTPGTTTIVSSAGNDPTLTAQWTSLVLHKRGADTWVAEGSIS
jgi:hypothetical protein